MVRSVASAAFSVAAVSAFTSAAVAVVSVASAASACVDKLSVETFCKLFFSSLAYGKDLSFEMKGLAGHLMVKVHLDAVFCHFDHYARNHSAHAVHHRDCIAWNEEVFANFSVHFECCFREIDDPARIDFAVAVCRCKCHIKCASWLHAFDMCFKFRKKASCTMYVIEWSFLCCVVDDLAVNFEFIAEFNYLVLFYLHFFIKYISKLCGVPGKTTVLHQSGGEGYVIKSQARNLPACTFSGVGSGSDEAVPERHHVTGNKHFPDRVRNLSVVEGESFDAE